MKFAGKKLISLVLVAMLVVSTLIVGTVSASATGWSIASGAYIVFDNSNTSWTLSRSYILLVTSSNVLACSLTTSGSGSFTKAKALDNVYYLSSDTLIGKFSGYSWSDVEYATLVTTNTGSSLATGTYSKSAFFENNALSSTAKSTYKISAYTVNYTGIINDSIVYRYCFVPAGSSNGAAINMYKLNGSGGICANQNINFGDPNGNVINAANYGISVDVSSYSTATGLTASASTQSAVSGVQTATAISVLYSTSVSLTANENDGTANFAGWFDSDNHPFPDSNSYTNSTINVVANQINNITAKYTIAESTSPTEPSSSGGETGTFNFYAEKSSATKTSKIFFERSGGNWATEGANNKVFALLYTSSNVYSIQLPQIKNSQLNAASAYSIINSAQALQSGITWADITAIAFIELEPSNSHPATTFAGKDKTEDLGLGALDSATATAKGINCYTAKYSTAVSDGGAVKYHYFKPDTNDNGATVTKTTIDDAANFAQNVYVPNYGGYVSIASYKASGTSITEQDNVSDAIYTEPSTAVNFDAAYTSTVTLTATPNNANYSFVGWYSDSACTQSISAGVSGTTYTYKVDAAKTVYAKFRYSGGGSEPAHYAQNVTVYTNNSASDVGGAVVAKFGDSTQKLPYISDAGSEVTLTAFPSAGYQFDGFYDGGSLVYNTNTKYTYTISGAKTFTAKFSTKSNTNLTQSVSVSGTGGTAAVSGGGSSGASVSVAAGTSVTFTATPDTNYSFYGWYTESDGSGMPLSTEATYTVTVNTANSLYAKFVSDTTNSDTSDSSLKNNKSRDDNATSLSAQALDYYQNEASGVSSLFKNASSGQVYSSFVELQGNNTSNGSGTSWDAMQNNDLFDSLYEIMSETHTHGVSYAAYGKNSLAHYWLTTDTSYANVNDGRGVYSFFYSDIDCYNHENMQREHIWPKSKASYLMKTGLGGSDLHHLRPAYGKVNNIKSNWSFADIRGQSGWTKVRTVDVPRSGQSAKTSLWRAEKNGETFCDYNTDVHGDIARILLYIYTRWKQPNLYSDITDEEGNPDWSKLPELDPDDTKDTGERIIYDRATLLKWMQEDPVSEWEMKRNDLTQNIQGNRNVFIDYPELAWLLFDQSVPSMTTPSGMANSGTDINKLVDNRNYSDKVTLDFADVSGNGSAEITAYNNTVGKAVKSGDIVDRGDSITYTVVPNQSSITKVTEFSTDNDNSGKHDIVSSLSSDSPYSFTKQAGYYNGSPNTNYKKERLKASLTSGVCELSIKINSKTATGNAGGSGSGMVTARKAGTTTLLDNGDTVPNGTSVTFTFTPSYGSKFAGVTFVNQQTATAIAGTDSYQYTTTLDCSNGSTREKTITAYFAQTFNANDKVTDTESPEYDKKQHINNKGMRPEAADLNGSETDFTTNFEICGVQLKHDDNVTANKALRFISVIDKDLLDKAQSYGWVVGKTKYNFDTKTINRLAYTLVKDGANAKTVPCTGTTGNPMYGDYSDPEEDTPYKYVSIAINNIQAGTTVDLDTKIIARPYVELKSEYVGSGAPTVVYGQYVDFSTGENYCACSGSWNYINSLAS